MRKSLLVTLEYPPQVGGVSNYYYNLVKNVEPEAITVLDNTNNDLLYNFFLFPWIKSFFCLRKKIINKEFDVLLVGQVLPLGTVAWLLHKIYKIPYIVFTHAMDITYPQKYPRKKWLMKKILNRAQKIITVSRYTKFELLKILHDNSNQRKIEIISPAPNITPERFPVNKEKQSGKILLSVGRLVGRKGYDMVIKAMPKILQQVPDCKYVIVGDGEYKTQLVDLTKKLNLEDKIVFKGKLANHEVAQCYQDCDVFIMSSRETPERDVEGFGLVYLEANSFGKPVIGGKSGGVEDAVVDGETGFLVEPENQDMIAEAVIRLLTKPELAQKLGQQSKQRVERDFTWQANAKQLQNILA